MLDKAPKPDRIGIHVRYDGEVRLCLEAPPRIEDKAVQKLVDAWE